MEQIHDMDASGIVISCNQNRVRARLQLLREGEFL